MDKNFIYITENYRLSRYDKRNYIVEEYRKIERKIKPTTDECPFDEDLHEEDITSSCSGENNGYAWCRYGYYTTLQGAIIGMFRNETFKAVEQAKDLSELEKLIKATEERLLESVKDLKLPF